MISVFYSRANKTYFHDLLPQGFTVSLVLKVRVFRTRKWPLETVYFFKAGYQARSYTTKCRALAAVPFHVYEIYLRTNYV